MRQIQVGLWYPCSCLSKYLGSFVFLAITLGTACGQDRLVTNPTKSRVPADVLTNREMKDVEEAVDRGLAFLIKQQQASGSFQTNPRRDPGLSGLCLMAFLSRGHVPVEGPYGARLQTTVDFMMGFQQSDGLLSERPLNALGPNAAGDLTPDQLISVCAAYNHGIGALVLSEVYGMNSFASEEKLRKAIESAIEFTSRRYPQPKKFREDEGGWRYLNRFESTDADLSITSWNVLFLRSAKNSGFDVDVNIIDEALAYLKRNYDPTWKTFRYEIHNTNTARSNNHPRGMAGAGILSLALAGEHDSEQARSAAKFILDNPFDQYRYSPNKDIYPTYGSFYCSAAMFQLGGDHWKEFYPRLVKHLLHAQRADGSWLSLDGSESHFGSAYSTALTILALTPPYQMLPIFQR